MIRRDSRDEQQAACWLLIAQRDHARISGELAAAWGGPGFARLAAWPNLVAAVTVHDDGWAEWDASPAVDPRTGAPRAFTEMPLGDALTIWRRSIDRAEQIGPLAACVVARHFLALLEYALSKPCAASAKRGESHDYQGQRRREEILDDESMGQAAPRWSAADPGVEQFLATYDAAVGAWLAQLQESRRPHSRDAAADVELGLAYLQMFDWISLWLCCAERRSAETFVTPDGPVISIEPCGAGFVVGPWPFHVGGLLLTTSARRVVARKYASRDDLDASPAETVELAFALGRS